MRKQFFTIPLIALLFSPLISHAGGGWVGNGPMLVAAAPTTIYQPSYSEPRREPEKKWNSLLLPSGKTRITAGFEQNFGKDSSISLVLNFDHAFSENWTTYGLTTWGYSLLPGNGKGSEIALFFGLLDGIGYSNFNGLITGPGVGVGYAYTWDQWRLTSRLSTMGNYGWKSNEWLNSKIRMSADLQYFVSDKWAVGIESGARYYTYVKSDDCELYGCFRKTGDVVTENTMLYVTRKITPQVETTLGIGTRETAFAGLSVNF